MNRRKFIQVIGAGFIATLASNILAACGGSGGSSGGASGTASDIWESYTVSGSVSGVTKTYTVEIAYNHFHSATALSVTTFQSATTNNSIQGTSHPHYFDLSASNVTTLGTVGGTVTVTSTDSGSGHTHDVRITRTV